jgi:hypothetical protein
MMVSKERRRSPLATGLKLAVVASCLLALAGLMPGVRADAGGPDTGAGAARNGGHAAATSQHKVVPPPLFGASEFTAFPNPASIASRLRYRLNQNVSEASIKIFDSSNRLVRTIAGSTAAGVNTAVWALDTDEGAAVANGVYVARLRLRGGGSTATEKVKIAVFR